MVLYIHTDGGSRHNPGPAASAYIIQDESGNILHQEGCYLGVATNNRAEYQAVVLALDWLSQNKIDATQLHFYLDSLLVVNQLSGIYKIKDAGLSLLASKIQTTLKANKSLAKFTYIPRAKNYAADLLVNQTLDLQS